MIKRYIIHAVPEFILCLVAAVALTVNVLQGFKLTDRMYTSYGMFIVVTAIVLAALFLVCYSSRTKLIGIPVLIGIAAVLVVVCYQLGYSLLETDVIEDNWGTCVLVMIVIAVLVFAASRTRLGSGIFAIAGAITHAWICVCLYDFSVWALAVFLLAAGVQFLYTRYRHQIIHADARKHAFLPLMGTSVVVVVLAITLSAGVWFGIIAPTEPPTMDITLVTRVVSIEVLERVGISKKTVLLDRSNMADTPDDYETDSDELNDEQEEEEEGMENSSPEDDASLNDDLLTGQNQNIFTNTLGGYSIRDYPVLLILLIVVIAAAVVGLITRFQMRHKIRLKKLSEKDRDEQVRLMYHLFRSKMKRMGISGALYDSPVRSAEHLKDKTVLLDEGGPTWLELSEIFSRLAYGGISPGEEEYDSYVTFYHNFWKACRKICGFRYLWKQFWL